MPRTEFRRKAKPATDGLAGANPKVEPCPIVACEAAVEAGCPIDMGLGICERASR